MSVTVEELEIIVRTRVDQAIKDLERFKPKLKQALAVAMPNMQSQMAPITQAMQKNEARIQSTVEKSAKAVKKSSAQMKASLKEVQDDYAGIEEAVKRCTDRMAAQEKAVPRAKKAITAEPVAKAVGAAPGMSTESLKAYLNDDISKEQLTKSFDFGGSLTKMQEALKNLPMDAVENQMQRFEATGKSTFDNINEQIKTQERLLKQLKEQYASVAKEKGVDSSEAGAVSGKILSKQNSVSRLQSQLGKLNIDQAAYNKLQSNIGKVKNGTAQAVKETKKYEAQTQATANVANKQFQLVGKSIQLYLVHKAMQGIQAMVSALTRFAKTGIQDAIAAPETENLFRVALSGLSDEAEKFAESMNTALGIDPYVAKEMLGTFQQIGTAIGVGDKTALGMSKSMTMLSQDISSLYNVDAQKAYENLQSALEGQGRAVRKYGFVITEQTVKETAYRHGIVQSGQELSEQQKYVARGILLMEQSKNAHGDMSNTLFSTQNMIRTLTARTKEAGRAFGDAFMPLLNAVLPYLNALAILLQRAGTAFARFTYSMFGKNYDAEKKKQQEVIDGYQGMEDAQEGVGNAAVEAQKKAERSVLGFDKLNRLQEPASKTNSKPPSTPNYNFDWGYDDDLGKNNPFEKMADDIEAFFNRVKKYIPKEVFENLRKAFERLKTTYDKLKESLKNSKFIEKLLGYFATESALKVTNFVNALSALLQIFDGIISKDPTKVFDGLKNLVVTLSSAALEPILHMLDNIFGTNMLGGMLKFKQALLDFNLSDDCIEKVDLFGKGISNITRQKVEPFLKQIDALDVTMKSLSWSGKIIKKKDVDDVKAKVAEISGAIIKELDADQNQALKNLAPLKGIMNAKEYAAVLADSEKYYESQKKGVESSEKQINEIMKTAAKDNRKLKDEEKVKIAQIQESMKSTGIKHLSESEQESLLIMQRLKDGTVNMSAQQASEVVKNSFKAKEETIKNATKQYMQIETEAKRMLETEAITEVQYDKIIAAATKSKDETIKNAEEQHEGILTEAQKQAGDLAKNIDWSTGEIKSKYEVMKEAVIAKFKEMAVGVAKKVIEIKDEVVKKATEIKDGFVNKFSEMWNGVKSFFTKEKWKKLAEEATSALKGIFDKFKITIKTPKFKWVQDGLEATGALKKALEFLSLPTSMPRLDVSWYAKGGLFKKPSVIGVGEDGTEAVMPLERNTQWIGLLARKIQEYNSMPTIQTQIAIPDTNWLQASSTNAPSQTSRGNAITEANTELAVTISTKLNEILKAIYGLELIVSLDGDVIAQSTVSKVNNTTLRTGLCPIKL